jgi:hypothetical protein
VIRSDVSGVHAGKRELEILQMLNSQSTNSNNSNNSSSRNVCSSPLKLFDCFTYHGHICIVVEKMHSSLRYLDASLLLLFYP